eukprot:TRINITY_DN10889_c0_g1_i1.p1 TRINITY_DN10889_c0_g1~~TRINITY_DN10889_c0_g1_i1.p1  ORF type:complete len:148 (+),score=47.63 TRINITY_DN10889_c0_g1_i1:23-466(+)
MAEGPEAGIPLGNTRVPLSRIESVPIVQIAYYSFVQYVSEDPKLVWGIAFAAILVWYFGVVSKVRNMAIDAYYYKKDYDDVSIKKFDSLATKARERQQRLAVLEATRRRQEQKELDALNEKEKVERKKKGRDGSDRVSVRNDATIVF